MTTTSVQQRMLHSGLAKPQAQALTALMTAIRAAFLAGSATYDAPSIAAAGSTTTAITVAGAAVGDFAIVSLGVSPSGLTVSGYVSAANTVVAVLANNTAGAIDLGSTTIRALVLKKDYFNPTTIAGLLA